MWPSTGTGTAPRWRTSSATASTAPPCGTSLRDTPGQPGLDVGRAAGRDHGRLASPAHRDHRRAGHPGRHGVRGGKAMIATLRWRLMGSRLADPPRPPPDPAAAARPQPAPRGPCPAPGPARPRLTRTPSARIPVLIPGPPAPPEEGPQTANPAGSRAISMPARGILAYQDHLRRRQSAQPRYSRNGV